MRSTNSYKTFIKEDLKRFWPIPAGGLFLLLFFGVIYKIVFISGSRNETLELIGRLSANADPGFQLAYVFMAAASALAIFGYMSNERSFQAALALPVTRRSMYKAHFLSGIIFFTGPIMINAAALLMIGATFTQVCVYFAEAFTICAAIYAVTVFATVISGSTSMMIFNTALFNLLGILVTLVISLYCKAFLRGFTDTGVFDSIMKKAFVIPAVINDGIAAVPGYLIFAAAVAFAAYRIYLIRPFEKTGDPIIFGWVKVFILIITSFGGMSLFGFMMTGAIYGEAGGMNIQIAISFLFGFILSYWIMSMLLYKTVRVFNKRFFLTGAIAAACFTLLISAISLDIFGYAQKAPELSEIKSASCNVVRDDNYDGSETLLQKGDTFTSPDDINKVLSVHRIVSKKQAAGSEEKYSETYVLKNGKTFRREFGINKAALKESYIYRKALFESVAYKKAVLLPLSSGTSGDVSYYSEDGTEYSVESRYKNSLFAAMEKDLLARTYEQEFDEEEAYIDVLVKEAGSDDDGGFENTVSRKYYIHPSDKYTKEWLKKHPDALVS